MNWQLLGPLLVTTVLAIIGWFFVHRLNSERDLKNKRRETRVNYLVEAYRNIERTVDGDIEKWKGLESAIADIQLFGTASQVALAREVVRQFLETRTSTVTVDLLRELRRDLRGELGLEAINEDGIAYLRFGSNQSGSKATRQSKIREKGAS